MAARAGFAVPRQQVTIAGRGGRFRSAVRRSTPFAEVGSGRRSVGGQVQRDAMHPFAVVGGSTVRRFPCSPASCSHSQRLQDDAQAHAARSLLPCCLSTLHTCLSNLDVPINKRCPSACMIHLPSGRSFPSLPYPIPCHPILSHPFTYRLAPCNLTLPHPFPCSPTHGRRSVSQREGLRLGDDDDDRAVELGGGEGTARCGVRRGAGEGEQRAGRWRPARPSRPSHLPAHRSGTPRQVAAQATHQRTDRQSLPREFDQ